MDKVSVQGLGSSVGVDIGERDLESVEVRERGSGKQTHELDHEIVCHV